MCSLTLITHQRCAAHGTARDEGDGSRAVGSDVIHYLWDNLSPLLHQHMIAHMQMQLGHHIGIVQRGTAHLGSGQLHGIHIGHRRHGSRTPYLEHHLPQYGLLLLGLELVGNGPTGTLGRHAQTTLLRQGVDLEHYAVGGHGQELALGVPMVDVVIDVLQRTDQLHVLAYLESPAAGSLQIGIVAVAWDVVAKQVIEVGIQPALCHGAAVLALESAAGGIARIGKERFTVALPFGIEAVEGSPRHEHLTPYLELLGPVGACGQGKRHAADGAHILCHIITLHAVTTCHSTHQPSLLVMQADAQSVELQFAANLKGFAMQSLTHPLVELRHLLAVIGIGQTEHGTLVHHRLKVVAEVRPHSLSGAVGVGQLGMQRLQVLQAVHLHIEVLVGDDRCIEHIIVIVVPVQFIPQTEYLFLLVHILLVTD